MVNNEPQIKWKDKYLYEFGMMPKTRTPEGGVENAVCLFCEAFRPDKTGLLTYFRKDNLTRHCTAVHPLEYASFLQRKPRNRDDVLNFFREAKKPSVSSPRKKLKPKPKPKPKLKSHRQYSRDEIFTIAQVYADLMRKGEKRRIFYHTWKKALTLGLDRPQQGFILYARSKVIGPCRTYLALEVAHPEASRKVSVSASTGERADKG